MKRSCIPSLKQHHRLKKPAIPLPRAKEPRIQEAKKKPSMETPAQITCSDNCLVHLHSFSGLVWLHRRICPFQQYPSPDGIPRFLFTQANNQPILLSHIEIITLQFLLKKATIESLGHPAQNLVAILPASSNTPRYQSQLSAGAAGAGMRILFFIERPILAAYCYQSLTPGHRTVLVFELGGHILEVSLLTEDVNLKVKAAVSDLGCPLFNYMASELPRRLGIDITGDASALFRIRMACERAKDALCLGLGAMDIKFEQQGREVEIPINRDVLVWMNLNHLYRGILRCLMEAGVRPEAVDEIVLAGSSTNIPEVRQILREFFERQPFRCDIDPANLMDLSAMQYVNNVSASKAEKPLQSNLFLPFSPLHDDGREPFFLLRQRTATLPFSPLHGDGREPLFFLFHHSTVKAENLASSLFHHSTVKAENLASSLFHHSTVKAENLASSLFHHSTVKAENLGKH
ncbi:hypothetical protein M5K25_013662 [Dendrobium thyrsiflorum]|uniref:Uncharacterized protein n=1 Tax=Dendrobium thyrsiflorum TaxID=117978 RepID=A0ABD0UTV6_DENTH